MENVDIKELMKLEKDTYTKEDVLRIIASTRATAIGNSRKGMIAKLKAAQAIEVNFNSNIEYLEKHLLSRLVHSYCFLSEGGELSGLFKEMTFEQVKALARASSDEMINIVYMFFRTRNQEMKDISKIVLREDFID